MTWDGISGYISGLKLSDVPWKRLVCSYGVAARFPELFEQIDGENTDSAEEALRLLTGEIEHQATLWPCTPFALVFLVRKLKELASQPESDRKNRLQSSILDILRNVAEACAYALQWQHADPLPCFADLLEERHLLPANAQSEDTYMLIEEGFDFSDEQFFSFYFYSLEVLEAAAAECGKPENGLPECMTAGFLEALNQCNVS